MKYLRVKKKEKDRKKKVGESVFVSHYDFGERKEKDNWNKEDKKHHKKIKGKLKQVCASFFFSNNIEKKRKGKIQVA